MSAVALVLAAGWAAVLFGGARFRRHSHVPGRVVELVDRPGSVAAPSARKGPLEVLGGWVRRALWRHSGTDGSLDRWIGGAVLAGAVFVALGHPLLGLVVAGGTVAVGWRARADGTRREAGALAAAMPDLLDLLVVAVGAGCTAERAVRAVVTHAPEPLRPAWAAVIRRLDRGLPFSEALGVFAELPNDAGGPIARLLVASHLDGVALGSALERLADEARHRRRRQVDEAARRLPVRLLLPLVLCTLPAFALLTVVPVLLVTLGRLH